jgi:hypothetical protein
MVRRLLRQLNKKVAGTVIIVENDLGFAFWLGHALDGAGYNALPAVSVTAANDLVAELGIVVDLVVINAGVAGAAAFIASLRADRPACRVIALMDNPDDPPPYFPYVDLVEHRPSSIDGSLQADWLHRVRMVLSPGAFGFGISSTPL